MNDGKMEVAKQKGFLWELNHGGLNMSESCQFKTLAAPVLTTCKC